MAISMKKYVDIKSAINNIRTATEKDLIARIFTKNELMPREAIEFESAGEVANFFGTESEEYIVADKYFNFINKYARSPRKISFFRDYNGGINSFIWTLNPRMDSINTLKEFTNGTFKIKLYPNDTAEEITGIDLSSVTSLADVAGVMQTAIRAYGTTNSISDLEQANFTFSTTVESFVLELSGISDFDVEETELSASLDIGGYGDNSIKSVGVSEEDSDYRSILEDSYQKSNNFATYTFLDTEIDNENIEEIAKWAVEEHPSEFMSIISVTENNKETIQTKLANVDGVSLELCGATEDTGKYNFVMPMAITATTDYNKENGTVNYMYMQSDDMKVVVDDDDSADDNDKLKINYYGRTQQAGQKLAFYQNGVLQGKYQDQSIFVNEIWLKDALTTKYINYMLLTSNWYANKSGQAIGQGLAMEVIQRAKLNGTITTEKEISEEDKVYIYNVTADENAWRQIYQEGYYLISKIEKKTIDGQEKYVFNYTLLYSKGDSIKKVEGTNILI